MKKILFTLPILFFLLVISSSAEGETVYQEVYYSNSSEDGHFNDLQDAIDNVAEGGLVIIRKDINVYSSYNEINVDKSIELIVPEYYDYKIRFHNTTSLFELDDIEDFKMTNISAIGSSGQVINGRASNIEIKDSDFDNCYPINILNSSQNDMNISIHDNYFLNSNISYQMTDTIAHLYLYNNTFEATSLFNKGIQIKNVNLIANNNLFENYGITILGGEDVEISSQSTDNTFLGRGTIKIDVEGEDIHFNRNRILKNSDDDIEYNKESVIDFTENWWGDKDGPNENIIEGNIDTSNWSLFDDFSRFKDDPYTIQDIKEAINILGQTPKDKQWIFDIDNNDTIELLDLIGITRKME